MGGGRLAHERRISVDRDRPDSLPGSRLGVLPAPDAISADERALIAPLAVVAPPVPWSRHPALLVATGQLDVAVQARGQVWDYAATSLIVEEAGGRFSGLNGQSTPIAGPALFARSAALHATALQLLTRPSGRLTSDRRYVRPPADRRTEAPGA